MRETYLDLQCLEDSERKEFKHDVWDFWSTYVDIAESINRMYAQSYKYVWDDPRTEFVQKLNGGMVKKAKVQRIVIDDPVETRKNSLHDALTRARLGESKRLYLPKAKNHVRRNH